MSIEEMLSAARNRLGTIRDDARLIDAARLLTHAHVNLVVVCDRDGVLTGVITRTDVVRQISGCAGQSCMTAAAAVMTCEVTSCSPADSLHDVWSVMRERGLKHVPVIDRDSRPLGVLYVRDVLQVLLREVEYEELLLRDYVMGIGYR
jgi:CBS domain-containing protein